jgi:hypothetical protein
MTAPAKYLWLVIWHVGKGGRLTAERQVIVDSIDVPESKRTEFETLMRERALPNAAKGATRGGGIVERQYLLQQMPEGRGHNNGMDLIHPEVKSALEELGISASSAAFVQVEALTAEQI